ASRMTPAEIETAGSTRLTHISGITPALSEGCRELTRAVIGGSGVVSFDVNYRPALWSSVEEAANVLADLARQADIVFVGRDEAEVLWGTATAEAVREFLPEPRTLVVKDAAIEAVTFDKSAFDKSTFDKSDSNNDTVVRVPSQRVEVVEPVGAGDAFAAGWLSGWLDGRSPRECLQLGHLLASRTVQIVGDCPDVPTADEIQAFLMEDAR